MVAALGAAADAHTQQARCALEAQDAAYQQLVEESLKVVCSDCYSKLEVVQQECQASSDEDSEADSEEMDDDW